MKRINRRTPYRYYVDNYNTNYWIKFYNLFDPEFRLINIDYVYSGNSDIAFAFERYAQSTKRSLNK